jgi:Cd2+/Zn2+-exporting ATPase
MEKKIYLLENLECANCAAKIEKLINALPEIQEATITFATRQLRVTAENPDDLIPKMQEIARTVESEVTILPRDSGKHHHENCHCHEHHHEECHYHDHHDHGHEHHHDEGHGETITLLLGTGLFLIGLVLNWVLPGWWTAIPFCAAYLVLGLEVLKTAGKNMVKGKIFDENFLMSLATLGALVIQEFPEAAGVMLFYRIGEFFEHQAVERSRKQIMDAIDLRPDVVNLLTGE